jgi:hypothetical protein
MWIKESTQKTKQNKRYSKYSDIVSKAKHRFSRVRNPCFKSLSKDQRSVRTPFWACGRSGGRFGSTKRTCGRGKDLTGVRGYLRTTEGQTSVTFCLSVRKTRTNKPKLYRNSQRKIFTGKRNQNKPFGSKINKNKGYRKNQSDNFSKLPVRRNKLTSAQKKNFGKVLLPYFGKQIV